MSSKNSHVSQSRLAHLLDYDRETGVFTWRRPSSNRVQAGQAAGSLLTNGYLNIAIDGRRYRAHRLAWLYVYGRMPEDQIDHINRNKLDNRIANLREATNLENHRNMPRQKNNTSGIIGVSWCAYYQKWRAHITVLGKLIHLKYSDSLLEAASARKAAEIRYGFHAAAVA